MKKPETEKGVPRFVMTLTDTQSTVQVSVGADDLRSFWRPIKGSKKLQDIDNSCEITRVFGVFAHDVAARDTKWIAYHNLLARESEEAVKRSGKRGK